MARRAVLAGWLLGVCACSPTPDVATAFDASTEKTPPPVPDAAPVIDGPTKLSETGLYADFGARSLTPGILELSPKYPLWSDGAEKRRFLLLPDGTKIDTTSMDDWTFPVGTRVWKQFTADGKLVETRLLWKKTEAIWFEMAYAWLPDESDAIAVPTGVTNARGTTHDVPDQVKCHACHDNTADTLLGLGAIQLSDGGNGMLTTLAKSGRLTAPPAGEFTVPGSPTVQAALGYMHGNCGSCHNDLAKFKTQTALRLRVLTTETTIESTGVYRTAFGLTMVHQIPPDILDALVAGDPDHSGIYVRMSRRDGFGMPPQCTKVVDTAGSAAVRAWIAGMVTDAGLE